MKPAPLLAGVALLAWAIWRRDRLDRKHQLLVALGVAALGVYGAGLIHLPKLQNVLLDVGTQLGQWTYLLVGVMAFLETGAFVGFIAPGEVTVVVGGVVAGQGEISVVVLIGIVWACAVAGDVTSYWLGRRLGRGFMLRHGPRFRITEPRVKQVEEFFDRRGGATILIGRFIGLVRPLAPFIAGASRMRFARFLPYDVIGAGLWASTFCVIGYVAWRSIDRVLAIAERGLFAFGTIVVVGVGAYAAVRWLRVPENRAQAEAKLHEWAEKPALRPVAAVARPLVRRVAVPFARRVKRPIRFAWRRLTPGDLGLELSSVIAVTGVGLYVFVALRAQIRDRALLDMDDRALGWARDLSSDRLDDIALAASHLGDQAVIWVVVLAGAAIAILRRAPWPGIFVVLAFPLTIYAVHWANEDVARPRPPDPVSDGAGFSYPSAHAAYAVAWVAAAVVAMPPGVARRAMAITLSVLIAAAIGGSRVELRAHYLSDVLGGFGLGAAIFGACGILGLVVGFLMENRHAADRATSE
jgi:membrane protein DedA with SNARE-associated domain/membrane-associated phospholipid phosphatase